MTVNLKKKIYPWEMLCLASVYLHVLKMKMINAQRN